MPLFIRRMVRGAAMARAERILELREGVLRTAET